MYSPCICSRPSKACHSRVLFSSARYDVWRKCTRAVPSLFLVTDSLETSPSPEKEEATPPWLGFGYLPPHDWIGWADLPLESASIGPSTPGCNRALPVYRRRVLRSSNATPVEVSSQDLTTITAGNDDQKVLQSQVHSSLLHLPFELRTEILRRCVTNALACPSCDFHNHVFTADPALNNLISGISPFPLLFVNRQLHQELLPLIYSRLSPISITGYYLKSHRHVPDEFRQLKATPKWPIHPQVSRWARSVRVFMTYGRRLNREWRFDGRWYYITLDCPSHIAVYDHKFTVIPQLVSHLKTYESLRELEIVVEVHQKLVNRIPYINSLYRMKPFLELHQAGVQIRVRFEMDPSFEVKDEWETEEIQEVWMDDLQMFLDGYGRIVQVEVSEWGSVSCLIKKRPGHDGYYSE